MRDSDFLPIEVGQHPQAPAPSDGMRALHYIMDAPVTTVPNHFSFAGDELALAEYEHVHSALTRGLFYRLDYVAAQVVRANPGVRQQFLAGDRQVISEFPIGDLHRYEIIRHDHEGGNVQYVVARTDDGQQHGHGGFHLVRKADGVVLFRAQGVDPVTPGTDEYLRALAQAGRFVDVFARHVSVPASAMSGVREMTTTEQFGAQLANDSKLHNRVLRKLGAIARGVQSTGRKLTTHEVTRDDDVYGPQTVRKLAPGKIALLLALAPIPGYSERLFPEIPGLLRPSGVEAVVDAAKATVFSDNIAAEKRSETLAAYNAQDLSLPKQARVTVDGRQHDISVTSSVDKRVSSGAPVVVQAEPTISGANMILGGMSPVRLETDGLLAEDACAVIEIDSSVQTGNYSLTGVTESDVADLAVEASQDAIRLCNTKDRSILLHDRRFYVDVNRQ